MKNMPGLLGRVKALREEGLTAYVWSGGYDVPPTTLTKSVRDDILFVAEVIGAGEVAVADERSTDPSPHELAKLVSDAFIGGRLARKAGRPGVGRRRVRVVAAGVAQLAEHPPAHPQQQHAAGQRDTDDRQQLHGDGGEGDAHHRRRADAPEDRLAPLLLRQPGGRHADDDGVVAGQDDVDEQDLGERDQPVGHRGRVLGKHRLAGT
jgi:hypothetical protein